MTQASVENQRECGFPIVPLCDGSLSRRDKADVDQLATRLKRDEPALGASRYFGPLVMQGAANLPSLIIGDQQEVGLFSNVPPSQLDYRMATLARDGDIVIVHKRNAAFECYLAKYLELKDVQYLEADTTSDTAPTAIPITCRVQTDLRSAIEDYATNGEGINIVAYLATGHLWRLGREIAENCKVPVHICGPSPRISKRINNKVWFTNLVHDLIGPHSTPPSYAAFGPAAATALVARLSRISDRVVVKIPDSAGSVGNFTFEASHLANMPLRKIRTKLLKLMRSRGWQDKYPVQIGVWDSHVVSSPSAQLWIPLVEHGPPVIEGLYEQVVQGEEGKFVGARPAHLSGVMREKFIREAMKIAALCQHLGYFGRCSLDAIISQTGSEPELLHWIECNGRWGGVSIPMTLRNILHQFSPINGLTIVQQVDVQGFISSTKEVLDALRDILFKSRASSSGIVLLSPIETFVDSRLNFVAFGRDQAEADRLAKTAVSRLQAL